MNLIKTVMEGDCTVNNLLQTAEKNDTARVCGYSIVPGGLSCILANMAWALLGLVLVLKLASYGLGLEEEGVGLELSSSSLEPKLARIFIPAFPAPLFFPL